MEAGFVILIIMQNIKTSIRAKVYEWLALDYRSLALMRMGIGLVLICDLIQRSSDLIAHYTDQGILPRSELLQLWNNEWFISLHMASGLTSFEILLFIIAGIFACMLLVGYRTELAMIISWFLLLSLHARNPMILQGGDVILRVVMFWMLFLPLNRAYSLDRLFNRIAPPKEKTVLSSATIGYIVQICLIYVFTGLLKTGDAWHTDGTAVYYALNIDQLVIPLGAWLRTLPELMTILTHVTLYLELYGVLLFFSPIKTGFFRLSGIVLFALLQIGFNSSMRLGLFGMIAIVVTLGLLPKEFWDNWFSRFHQWLTQKSKSGLTIYYDFECTFCAKASVLLKRLLFLHPGTQVLPATTNSNVLEVMLRENSWVIQTKDGAQFTGWEGFTQIIHYSPFSFLTLFLSWKPNTYLGEKIYRFVAHHREQVCQPEPVQPLETKNVRRLHTVRDIILVVLTFYIILWNIQTQGKIKIFGPESDWIALTLRLDQQFNMFAPTPLLEDGWYVIPGTLRDGSEVDIFSNRSPVSYEKPKWVAYTYKNQRWQKYMMNLWNKDFEQFRLGYGQYLCRTWNTSQKYSKQLMTFNIIFMTEKTPRPGEPIPQATPTTLWQHQCF